MLKDVILSMWLTANVIGFLSILLYGMTMPIWDQHEHAIRNQWLATLVWAASCVAMVGYGVWAAHTT